MRRQTYSGFFFAQCRGRFANVGKNGHNARKGRKRGVQRVFPIGWVHYAPTAKKARTIKIRGN